MADRQSQNGLLAVLEGSRSQIARYLAAHGAGEMVDDLMQELAIRLAQQPTRPVASPLSYIYRAATHLMIDHRRSLVQARQRDGQWAESVDQLSHSTDPSPSADRIIDGKSKLEATRERLAALPDRARTALLMHRVDGTAQKDIANALGVSLSTVESDLRLAYAALVDLREHWTKAEGP